MDILKDKVAVVTGGSRGIGKAIALKFASEGANVAILCAGKPEDLDSAVKEAEAYGVKAAAYPCHVDNMEEVTAAVKQVLAEFGRVDILVNNAGITRDKLMLTMKDSDFTDVINVNLVGVYNVTRQLCPTFLKQKSGRIINISSIAGIMGNPGQTNYAASKAGIIGLTKSLAKEIGSRGITCNAIAPGFIATDMTKDFADKKEVTDAIPLRRMGKPEEVAALATFLASDIAGYITGEVIRIDGGMAM